MRSRARARISDLSLILPNPLLYGLTAWARDLYNLIRPEKETST